MKTLQNQCLNFIKGIACILVVFLHVGFPGKFGEIVGAIATIGVPIFFMVSGYFTWKDGIVELGSLVKRRVEHIAKMLLAAACLYLVHALLYSFVTGGVSEVVAWFQCFTVKNIIKLIVLNMTSFIPYCGILWFMLALIYDYVAFYVLKRLRIKWCYLLIPALLLFHLVARYGLTLAGISYGSVYFQNWLFDGLPFFLLGNYLRSKADSISQKKLSPIAATGFLAVSCLMMVLEHEIFGYMSFYFGTILVVVVLFVIAIQHSQSGSKNPITIIGEKYYMYVYLLHTIVSGWMGYIFKLTNATLEWFKPILCLGITIFISVIYTMLKERIKTKNG